MVNLSEHLDNKLDAAASIYEQEIERVRYNRDRQEYFINKVRELVPELNKVFQQLGVEVSRFSATKTGSSSDWTPDNYMHVSLSLTPVTNKIKFIKFAGYDKNGRGKNQKRLNEKADKIANIIGSAISNESVSVNPFSLEIEREQRAKSISVEFWIK